MSHYKAESQSLYADFDSTSDTCGVILNYREKALHDPRVPLQPLTISGKSESSLQSWKRAEHMFEEVRQFRKVRIVGLPLLVYECCICHHFSGVKSNPYCPVCYRLRCASCIHFVTQDDLRSSSCLRSHRQQAGSGGSSVKSQV